MEPGAERAVSGVRGERLHGGEPGALAKVLRVLGAMAGKVISKPPQPRLMPRMKPVKGGGLTAQIRPAPIANRS